MENLCIALISRLNSSVFILLALLGVAFWGIFKIGRWSEKFKHQDGRLQNVEKISDNIVELRTKVDLIYQIVNPNSPVRAASPLTLTPIGEEISKKIGADKILSKYSEQLKNAVEKRAPKNAYDIQQESIETAKTELLKLLDEKELIAIKEEAFSKGILVEDVLSVFGVLLRNHILKLKNIPISEVDKHSKNSPK